jgi:hypothetical protein
VDAHRGDGVAQEERGLTRAFGACSSQFLTRFQLHRTVYNHRTALSLDAMIMDAFLAADQTLGISEAILEATSFLRLSDSTLNQIEHSRDSRLAASRDLIARIRRRRLYRFVDETLLPKGCCRRITELDVSSYHDSGSSGVDLRPEDLVIFTVKLNFGRGDANPVESVYFFKEWEDADPVQIAPSQFSFVLPTVFEERIVRVYLTRYFADKSEELRAMNSVKQAFRRCANEMGVAGGHLPSPRIQDSAMVRRAAGSGAESDASDVQLGVGDVDPNTRLAKRLRPE